MYDASFTEKIQTPLGFATSGKADIAIRWSVNTKYGFFKLKKMMAMTNWSPVTGPAKRRYLATAGSLYPDSYFNDHLVAISKLLL